jgi:hypothetical protein
LSGAHPRETSMTDEPTDATIFGATIAAEVPREALRDA